MSAAALSFCQMALDVVGAFQGYFQISRNFLEWRGLYVSELSRSRLDLDPPEVVGLTAFLMEMPVIMGMALFSVM